MARIIKFVVLLIVFVIGLVFALLNAQSVQINYHFGSTEAPMSLVVVLALVLGAVLGMMVSLAILMKTKRQVSSLRKTVNVTERELASLRAMPIKGQP